MTFRDGGYFIEKITDQSKEFIQFLGSHSILSKNMPFFGTSKEFDAEWEELLL